MNKYNFEREKDSKICVICIVDIQKIKIIKK